MATDLIRPPRRRLDYHDFLRGIRVWPISPGVLADAVDAVHGLVRDGRTEPQTKVNAVKTLIDLGRLNIETARLYLEIDQRLGPMMEERDRAAALERDLKDLGWHEEREHAPEREPGDNQG
jgi:hypothetical protein